ncbi:MAG: RNA polymerase sigma-70 factor [Spongiibacteraceae bacterium]
MSTELFAQHRQRLFGIAYRMLGSRADAEDVLQDVYLRWHEIDSSQLQAPEAWLVTVTTRLCIDRLRAAKIERAAYTGPWLPEPLVWLEQTTPESSAELASDLSIALLNVLERLAPEERAAFLLREVFDVDYHEVARILEKNEPAVRQLVHRAKTRVRDERPRFEVTPQAHAKLIARFAEASRANNQTQMAELLAADAIFIGDGGGKVISALRILRGAERLLRLFDKINRFGDQVTFQFATINGELGILRFFGGELDAVCSFVTDGEKIHEIYVVRNPDKLRAVDHHLCMIH